RRGLARRGAPLPTVRVRRRRPAPLACCRRQLGARGPRARRPRGVPGRRGTALPRHAVPPDPQARRTPRTPGGGPYGLRVRRRVTAPPRPVAPHPLCHRARLAVGG